MQYIISNTLGQANLENKVMTASVYKQPHQNLVAKRM